jgi:hypothetical protein
MSLDRNSARADIAELSAAAQVPVGVSCPPPGRLISYSLWPRQPTAGW